VRRLTPLLLLTAVLAAAAGCAGGANAGGKPTLKVAAAASLKQAFTAYGSSFTAARSAFSFAGSDVLAAQIEQGARPDVYAAANSKLPAELYAKHLVERPVAFATNELVLAVPATGAKVRALADVARPGVSVARGDTSVPVGAYTDKVLALLPAAQRRAITANVRSTEPDVAGVVGKLTQGAVDAGFVYLSDVRGAGGRIKAIRLPARLQPQVTYAAAVVRGTKSEDAARRFVAGLRDAGGRRALEAAGFGAPPA
jgi:molybdate transport system substrate-binding protein